MQGRSESEFVGFCDSKRFASGSLAEVASAASRLIVAGSIETILVFDRGTGAVVDVDLRGTAVEVEARYAYQPSKPPRGRPALGVVAREITLLPRHWDWLARQPGGASTVLRRLVEAARKADVATVRERIDAAYRFMAAMAGDLIGFEEASRALFAQDRDRLSALIGAWPVDLGEEVFRILDSGSAS